MLRSLLRRSHTNEAGQSLPLFGLFFLVILGFCALSIDVGRFVWARTSMQAGVDAAAIAAAQDMPDWVGAQSTAATYWVDNSSFIQSQGTNVTLTVSQVPGNTRLRVQGDADVPTWFAKFFGLDHWHVSASGDAEAQVLDIAVVLDVSGSMCYDPPGIIHTESSENTLMSPGHASPRPMIIDQDTATAGNQGIPAGGGNSIVIRMNTVSGFSVNNRIAIHSNVGGTGSYEIFKITAISSGAKTLTVTRAQQNNWTGVWTTKIAHPFNAEVWLNRTGCANVARNTSPPYDLYPFDDTIANAEYFTTLFNPSYDKIGVADYSTTANWPPVSYLNSNLSSVQSAIHSMAPPNGSTNIAHGLAAGRFILDGTGKRANAVRVLVLITDGIPNVYCTNASAYTTPGTSCSQGSSATSPTSCSPVQAGMTHAWNQATAAKNADIKVFVIGLGDGVLDCVLQKIADNGNGLYYKAPTTAELDDAFKAIAEQTHIALVK